MSSSLSCSWPKENLFHHQRLFYVLLSNWIIVFPFSSSQNIWPNSNQNKTIKQSCIRLDAQKCRAHVQICIKSSSRDSDTKKTSFFLSFQMFLHCDRCGWWYFYQLFWCFANLMLETFKANPPTIYAPVTPLWDMRTANMCAERILMTWMW